jgi:hypothetical protein
VATARTDFAAAVANANVIAYGGTQDGVNALSSYEALAPPMTIYTFIKNLGKDFRELESFTPNLSTRSCTCSDPHQGVKVPCYLPEKSLIRSNQLTATGH